MSEAHQSSVQDGKLVRCSVSQIKTFNPAKHGGCMRRWGFQKIWHIEEKSGPGAEESTKCHTMAEQYLKTGWVPAGNNNLERTLIAGLWMLPERGPDLLVEMPFDGEISLAGVPFNGKIDVVIPRNELPPEIGRSVQAGDHKFHGDIERALTEDELRIDPQMLGYGMVMIAKYSDITHVRFTHYNYQKKEPRPPCKPVSVLMPVSEIRAKWASLDPLVARMAGLASSKDPGDLPANREACYAYGKKNACPHLARCANIGEKKMMLSAEEEAAFGVMTAGIPPSAPVAAQPAPKRLIEDQSVTPDAELKAIRSRHFAVGKSYKLSDGRTGELTQLEGLTGYFRVGTNVGPSMQASLATVGEEVVRVSPAGAPATVAILPPDAPASHPELAAACEPCKDEKNFQHKKEDCPKTAEPADGGKRKRRTKAEMEAARAAAPVQPEQTTVSVSQTITIPEGTIAQLPAAVITPLGEAFKLADEAADRSARNALARELLLAAAAKFDERLDEAFVTDCFKIAAAYVKEANS